MTISKIGELRTLTDALSKAVAEQREDLQTADPVSLLHCRRALLVILETLSLAQARRPGAMAGLDWNALTSVEASRRLIWLRGRPMKASEIVGELAAYGWRGRPTKTPVATLVSVMEHAHRHFCLIEDRRWALTPAAEQLERARDILAAGPLQPEAATAALLAAWLLQSRERREIDLRPTATPGARVLSGESVKTTRTRGYAGKAILEAARLCALVARKPMTTNELIFGMTAKGWTTKARNVRATVYGTLAGARTDWRQTKIGTWEYIGNK